MLLELAMNGAIELIHEYPKETFPARPDLACKSDAKLQNLLPQGFSCAAYTGKRKTRSADCNELANEF